jgi:hypothetical protein
VSEPDLYTPWREAKDAVVARHVGRERELSTLRQALSTFASGHRPLPIYLFGPRGVGKSHLLQIAAQQLCGELRARGVSLLVVPEDIPALRSADDLWARMSPQGADSVWAEWREGVVPAGDGSDAGARRVVFVEGLDRQLQALGARERKRLRHLLDRPGAPWIVGTGRALVRELTRTSEAFYGAFDPWPLEPLDDAHAATLLDRAAGRAAQNAEAWAARRGTLVLLAAGSPRALVALGKACCDAPTRSATMQLQRVLRELGAQYQLEFRHLSPNSQRIVELLAMAARESTPTEIAAELRFSVAQISVQAGRLVDEGVLRHRSEGRQSWYRLADPLFRYWLEYRSTDWDETRIGRAARLLEAGFGGAPVQVESVSPASAPASLLEPLQDSSRGRAHPELEALRGQSATPTA